MVGRVFVFGFSSVLFKCSFVLFGVLLGVLWLFFGSTWGSFWSVFVCCCLLECVSVLGWRSIQDGGLQKKHLGQPYEQS